MKPLTVLFHTWPVAFDCPGGGEVQLLKYMEFLEKKGIRTLRYDLWNPKAQFDEADIVHHFSLQTGSWRFCYHVVTVRKLPLVISPVVWIDHKEKYPLEEYRTLLHIATRILPNSRAECDQLAALFGIPSTRFTAVVNGVDEVFFEPISPTIFRDHFHIHEPFVLCMGNIEIRKNQLRLIEALAETDFPIVLAGQEREAEYAAQCHAVAGDNVHFVGTLEHGSDLHRSAYSAAEVLCLPSTLETPGLAALEAAAGGVRLALTEEGCTSEYFGGYAEYLNPYSHESIGNAVRRAFEKTRDSSLPERVRSRYTWQHAADQLLGVYKELSR